MKRKKKLLTGAAVTLLAISAIITNTVNLSFEPLKAVVTGLLPQPAPTLGNEVRIITTDDIKFSDVHITRAITGTHIELGNMIRTRSATPISVDVIK